MLYYDRTDISEGVHVNKTSTSKKFTVCHYYYILDKGFAFQLNICNRCHDVLMMPANYISVTILNIHGVGYCYVINGTSISEVKDLLQNGNWSEKKWIVMFSLYFNIICLYCI